MLNILWAKSEEDLWKKLQGDGTTFKQTLQLIDWVGLGADAVKNVSIQTKQRNLVPGDLHITAQLL